MPTACITHPNARIHLVRERLEVRGKPEEDAGPETVLREIPIRDLERVIVLESVQISSGAMAALLRSNIPVNFLGWNGQFLGGFLPPTPAHGLARLNQYRRALDPAFALAIAGRIVSAKVYNQRRVLQRLLAGREGEETAAAGTPDRKARVQADLAWLEGVLASVAASRTIEELRGYEGVSTARYFEAWAAFLPEAFPFERRSTRPPHNAVNACISFGATLIYQEMAAFLHLHGLDAALGLLHTTENGRWSLALDLMEPFRPALVEALALDLFSHQMLNAEHFEPKNGGVYLNDEGRRKYFLQYERRMERQFMSECAGHRTTLRQQLEQQAVMLKTALEKPEAFEPFLMN